MSRNKNMIKITTLLFILILSVNSGILVRSPKELRDKFQGIN